MPSRLRPWLAPGHPRPPRQSCCTWPAAAATVLPGRVVLRRLGKRLAWGSESAPAHRHRGAVRLGHGEGGSVLAFRLPAMLAHAGQSSWPRRWRGQLGGGASAMASAAVAVSAVNLAQGQLLTMNVFEMLLWSGTALAALQAASGRPRWLVAGALLAGARTAHQVLHHFPLALALLTAAGRDGARRELASRWLWAACASPRSLLVPRQWRAGLPFLELIRYGQLHNAPLSAGQLLGGHRAGGGAPGLAGLGALLLQRGRLVPGPFLGVALGLVPARARGARRKALLLRAALPPLAAAAPAEERRLRPRAP